MMWNKWQICRYFCGSRKPVSTKFGFDRGQPIDRYYIEDFLRNNSKYIKGKVLEIAESTYTKKFGDKRVISKVMSYEKGLGVDYVVNLESGKGVIDNLVDCFICTQTYAFIYDVKAAICNSMRMVKPGGILLITVPGITQISRYDMDRWGHYWSFTDLSLKRLLEEYVSVNNIEVKTYGNVKASTAFLYGLASSEISKKDLDHIDNDYQVVITAAVIKPKR